MKYFIAILSGFLSACGPDYIYEKEYAVPDQGWTYEDSLVFSVDIEEKDTSRLYNLYLEIEHSTDFGFQNLYTRIHTGFPDGKRLSKVLSLELAEMAGIWLGKCRRDRCTLLIPIQQRTYFGAPGLYTFTLEQYMRQSPAEGVRRIGFMVEDTGELRK
jgi:gliding motility-associated lipoprotein GldH